MPRVPTDYSQTCIYKLVHKDDVNNENVYIGSTTNFRHRKTRHKSGCNCENDVSYNNPKYQFIRENGGWENWQMLEIEKYPCNDKREAETRERYWIEHYKSNLNRCIPTRSIKEYLQDNCYLISEKKKQYRQENRDKCSQQNKKYYYKNRDRNLELMKKYRQQKKTCECGCQVSIHNISEHRRSAKHIKLMEQLNIPP